MELIQEDFIEQSQKISIYINRYIHQIKFLDGRVDYVQQQLEDLQPEYLTALKQLKEKKQSTSSSSKLNEKREQIEKLQKQYINLSHEKMKISDQLMELSKESQDMFSKFQKLIKPFDVVDPIRSLDEDIDQYGGLQAVSPLKPRKQKRENKQKDKLQASQLNVQNQFVGIESKSSLLTTNISTKNTMNNNNISNPLSTNIQLDTLQPSLEPQYCKCNGAVTEIDMIACDNENCEVQWFHLSCVGIEAAPEGDWYCSDCKPPKKKSDKKK